MIHPWARFTEQGSPLEGIYGKELSWECLRLRSVQFRPAGPAVYLRGDLPDFPPNPPSAWREANCDTVQVSLEFTAVEDMQGSISGLPQQVRITGESRDHGMALFWIVGSNYTMQYTAIGKVRVGHVSAYRQSDDADGAEHVRHYFLGKIDSLIYREIPEPWIEAFHGKI